MGDKETSRAKSDSIHSRDQNVRMELVQAGSGIEVDVLGNLVRKEGNVLPILGRAHTLLIVLASNIGEIVPRNVAINEVFGDESSSSATKEDLNVLVWSLRRRLGIKADGPIRVNKEGGIVLLSRDTEEEEKREKEKS